MNESDLMRPETRGKRSEATMAALRRAALWGSATFVVSALFVGGVAWMASGAGAVFSTPALLVALALGLATGWAVGLIVFTRETLRLLAAGVEARVARARREAARQR
jgi:hypothetical protein